MGLYYKLKRSPFDELGDKYNLRFFRAHVKLIIENFYINAVCI